MAVARSHVCRLALHVVCVCVCRLTPMRCSPSRLTGLPKLTFMPRPSEPDRRQGERRARGGRRQDVSSNTTRDHHTRRRQPPSAAAVALPWRSLSSTSDPLWRRAGVGTRAYLRWRIERTWRQRDGVAAADGSSAIRHTSSRGWRPAGGRISRLNLLQTIRWNAAGEGTTIQRTARPHSTCPYC